MTVLPVNVTASPYNAVGDGSTNDTTAFTDWINDLNTAAAGSAGSAEGYVPAGHYIINSAWPAITSSNVAIVVSPGAILDFSGATASSGLIVVQGSQGSPVALTATANEGATSLSVAAGSEAGFAGSYLLVYSNQYFDPNRTMTHIGEQGLCTSTSSGTIDLWTPLAVGPYNTTSYTPEVLRLSHNTGFCFRGGTIIGSGTTYHQQGLYLDTCRDARIDEVTVTNCNAVGIAAIDSMDVIIRGCAIYHCTDSNLGYGVEWINTATDCLVADTYFSDCRHAVTNGGATGRNGIALRCGAQDCTLWGNQSTGDGFDTHACGLDLFYEFCKVYGNSGQGFNIECPRARVIGCELWRSGANGIGFHNESNAPTDYECRANKIYYPQAGSNGTGIQYEQASASGAGQTIQQVVISENVIYGSYGNAIQAITDGTYRAPNVKIMNNLINAPGAHGIVAEYLDRPTISGNTIDGLPASHYGIEGLSVQNATITGNNVNAASSTSTTGIYLTTSTGKPASANCAVSGNVINGCATGILLDNTCSDCTITGNDPSGCTTLLTPGTGTGHLIADNQWGSNPPAKASLSVGASPWTHQNTTGYRLLVVISGGTVSAIKYSRDGTNFYAGSTSGVFVLDPGDYLQVTYSAAPTICETFPLR